jgi:hypothetical protein
MRLRWTHPLPASARGLTLAREPGLVLVWDANHWVYLLSRGGGSQAHWHAPGNLVAACASDDGSAYGAVGDRGEVWWLAPDLMPRWGRGLSRPATATALDSLGQYLAVADNRGRVYVFNQLGKFVFKTTCARPLHHLAFIPAAPFLVGSSDFGLVACFDVSGKQMWRDGLVAHVGALAVNGDGSEIVLACFSEGLQRYAVSGQNLGRLSLAEPCRLAAISYDGRYLLASGLGTHLRLLTGQGQVLYNQILDKPASALALSPLGDMAVVALADGPVIGLSLRELIGEQDNG